MKPSFHFYSRSRSSPSYTIKILLYIHVYSIKESHIIYITRSLFFILILISTSISNGIKINIIYNLYKELLLYMRTMRRVQRVVTHETFIFIYENKKSWYGYFILYYTLFSHSIQFFIKYVEYFNPILSIYVYIQKIIYIKLNAYSWKIKENYGDDVTFVFI